MKTKFFKTFKIKERWWDCFYDHDKLYLGHYNTYNDLYNSLKNNNGWNSEETKQVIKKECIKQFPRITDQVLLELILILNKSGYNTPFKSATKEDLISEVLTLCMQNKNAVQHDVAGLFELPNNKSEEDCIELEDSGQCIG